MTRRKNIPVTTPVLTLIDLASCVPAGPLEAAINEADKLDLVHPTRLRKALEARKGQRGTRPLKAILDRATFALTDSELERYFLPIAARAGLMPPRTQSHVNGFRVDFYWPELGLVVETDGVRYHRTAEQQLQDQVRDQTHATAGLTPLRFTHWQVRYERTASSGRSGPSVVDSPDELAAAWRANPGRSRGGRRIGVAQFVAWGS